MKIITNNHYREIEYFECEDTEDLEPAFIYKGETFFLHQFMKINKFNGYGEGTGLSTFVDYLNKDKQELGPFDGILNLTMFNGLLITLHPGGDAVKVAYYYC